MRPDWILLSDDEVTAGDPAEETAADETASEETDDATIEDADATEGEDDAQDGDDKAPEGEELTEDEMVALLDGDDETEQPKPEAKPQAKPEAKADDAEPITDPAQFLERAEQYASNLGTVDAALAELQKDVDAGELPEGTAKAIGQLAAVVKSLSGIESLRLGALKAQVQNNQSVQTNARSKAMDDAGIPKNANLRNLVWSNATKLAKKVGPSVSTKAILAAAYRASTGTPLPAKSKQNAPAKPAGAIRSKAPATKPSAKPTRTGNLSEFQKSQQRLNQALGSA